MDSANDRELLTQMEILVTAAEAADTAHSTIITRVRLAHAKSMYIRARALMRMEPLDPVVPAPVLPAIVVDTGPRFGTDEPVEPPARATHERL